MRIAKIPHLFFYGETALSLDPASDERPTFAHDVELHCHSLTTQVSARIVPAQLGAACPA